LRFQIGKRGARGPSIEPEFTAVGDDRIIGSTVWRDEDGKHVERFQVLTVRCGKIVDLQGCETRREAERFARRRAV
jgi:hypothetical protein